MVSYGRVISSGTELLGGGCTSPKTSLGPGTVPLLLHPLETGLLVPVDLGWLCAESRIWKHQEETIAPQGISEGWASLVLSHSDLLNLILDITDGLAQFPIL